MAHGKNWSTSPPFIPGEYVRLYDPYTHALTVIQEPHRLAHDGMVFSTAHKTTALANGASFDILFEPSSAYVHMHRALVTVGDGDCDVIVYEGGDIAAGTPLVSKNTNRASSNTPQASVSYAPAVTTTGTLLHRGWIPPTGSLGVSQHGFSQVGNGEEWILAPNTNYLIRVTNNSGGAIDLLWDILWYEVSYVE